MPRSPDWNENHNEFSYERSQHHCKQQRAEVCELCSRVGGKYESKHSQHRCVKGDEKCCASHEPHHGYESHGRRRSRQESKEEDINSSKS